MSVLTKVGSFTKISGAGTQAITGVGFQPKAIMFWSTGSTGTAGTWVGNVYYSICFTAGAANSYGCAGSTIDSVATSVTGRRTAAKACIFYAQNSGGIHEADLASFDSDGFTLTWGTDTFGVQPNINFLALGGTDITGAKVVQITAGGSTGAMAVTGAGFKPDLVLLAGNGTASGVPNATHGLLHLGVMNKHGQQWSDSIYTNNAANPTNTSRVQQSDSCYVNVTLNDVINYEASFVSMDTDGFTVNAVTNTIGATHLINALCLQGVSSKIGTFAKVAVASPVTQPVTKVGFTPKAILGTNFSNAPLAAPSANTYWFMGCTDGTNQRAVAFYDLDATTPTNAKTVFLNDGYLAPRLSSSPSVFAKGSIVSMDPDGFTTSWNPSTTDQGEEVLYLAIGNAGVNTFPTRVN